MLKMIKQKYILTIESNFLDEKEDISKDLQTELYNIADDLLAYLKVEKIKE